MPPAMQARQGQARTARAAIAAIPFTAAAHKHYEPVTVDTVASVTAAQQQRGPFEIPAYGFLRSVLLEVSFSGATIGSGVLSPDWPWNILQNVALLDTNGAPIFGPLDGYALYLANKYGGYSYRQDPKLDQGYDGTINGKFFLRIPVEISAHNGYGAIANQNAANSYKVQWTINSNVVFSTQPTTPPGVTIRAHLEAWSQPAAADRGNRPQEREPVGHGTTQFWTAFTKAIVNGQNNILFNRVGNLIRNWVFVSRDNSGARVDTTFPGAGGGTFYLQWDARNLTNETQALRIKLQEEHQQSPAVRDVGVFVFPFNDFMLGHAGDEEPNFWIPTVQADRIELNGTATAAGTLQVITNDVTAVEVDPADRYVETSATGFHPALGQPVPQG